MESCPKTRLGHQDQPQQAAFVAAASPSSKPIGLSDWRFDHLSRMSDATGMLQHATHTTLNYDEGTASTTTPAPSWPTVPLLEELGYDGGRDRAARER